MKFQLKGIGLITLVPLFFGYAWSASLRVQYRFFSFVCVVAFVLGIVSISAIPRSWAMHHLIPAFPILIVGIFSQIPPRGIRPLIALLFACFILINGDLYEQLTRVRANGSHVGPLLKAYNKEINERFSGSHLMIVGSWGVYYTQLVYGPADQCLMWADEGDPGAIEAA